MVAHSGITKLTTGSDTPILRALRKVTGIVAAEDMVPTAVRYAGSMHLIRCNGFLPLAIPVTVNRQISQVICMAIAIMRTFPKVWRVVNTVPSAAISATNSQCIWVKAESVLWPA